MVLTSTCTLHCLSHSALARLHLQLYPQLSCHVCVPETSMFVVSIGFLISVCCPFAAQWGIQISQRNLVFMLAQFRETFKGAWDVTIVHDCHCMSIQSGH